MNTHTHTLITSAATRRWLFERRRIATSELPTFVAGVSLYRELNARFFRRSFEDLADWLIRDLERAGVARRDGDQIAAADAV